jgi:hypothetical protein
MSCPKADRPASLIQIRKFSERPYIVPNEVMRLNVDSRALSPKAII